MRIKTTGLKAIISLFGLLSAVSSFAATETCAVANFDASTASVNIPCVIAGTERLSLQLTSVSPSEVGAKDGLYWKLSNFGESKCQSKALQCSTFDSSLNLNISVDGVEANKRFAAVLKYYPSSNGNGFYWAYQSHQPLDTQNPVILKKATPNPNGAVESLFKFDGDFANFKDKKELQVDTGVIAPEQTLQEGDERLLHIFHINDFHSDLRIASGTKGDTHYMSQMVKMVKAARQKAAANEVVLFLSGGDDHIGNPFDELLGYDVSGFKASAAYRAYSAAGLDASVIGNHELDRGAAILAKAIQADAVFPVLSANVFGSSFLNKQHYSPAIIAVSKGLRIGILGLTTHDETRIKMKEDPTLDVSDAMNALTNTLPYVERFADVIVIMSHVGYNGSIDGVPRHVVPVGDIEFAERAALLTKKPVVIIGGHTHTVLNVNGLTTIYKSIPILQAGSHGSHLGEAQLTLFQTKDGLRSQAQAKLNPLKKRDKRVALTDATAKNFEQDTDIDLDFEKTVMQPLYDMLGGRLSEVIGQAGNVPEIAQDKVIAERYVSQSTMANFMNDAIVARSKDFPVRPNGSQLVDLAVFNASGVNGGITPNAPISFNDWYNVMPFADLIVVETMTGAQIKQMLQSNAQRIVRPDQLKENGGTVTADDLKGYGVSYGFLHFSRGLTYTIKLGNSAAEATATDIRLLGKPIDEVLSQSFNVAFGDFIATRGGEGWKGEVKADGRPSLGMNLTTLPQSDTGLIYRNEIIRFIKDNGVIDAGSGALKDDRLKIVP